MDREKLREALKYANNMTSSTYELDCVISTFKDLAESVLAVGAKMPDKEKDIRCACDGWNSAIDQCTLAFAGMIPEKDETDNDGWEDSGNMDDAYKAGSTSGWNACRDAILSAMKGGVK